ncbi:hypothetical protein [Alloprevotella tannerae]|uniref:hypothetical protein n=1 Tax=Alloprevotella tannerae TaxID=76122 RepID=UPI0025FFA276|nr:hypothetical protein [Alloprevotella tannerae]
MKTIDNAGILLFDFLFRTEGRALALSFVTAAPRYFSSFLFSFTALRDQPTTTNAALYNRLARPNHRLLPPNYSLFPANDSLLAANEKRRRPAATKRPRPAANADTLYDIIGKADNRQRPKERPSARKRTAPQRAA